MESIQSFIIAIGVFVVLLSFLGVSMSVFIKANKLPAWAKINPKTPWGHPWIDSKETLKLIMIRVVQAVTLMIISFLTVVGLVTKAMFKFTSSAAKAKK